MATRRFKSDRLTITALDGLTATPKFVSLEQFYTVTANANQTLTLNERYLRIADATTTYAMRSDVFDTSAPGPYHRLVTMCMRHKRKNASGKVIDLNPPSH